MANATARGKRMPNLPIIVLPHRYDHLPEDDIREDVRNRVGDVIKILTQD